MSGSIFNHYEDVRSSFNFFSQEYPRHKAYTGISSGSIASMIAEAFQPQDANFYRLPVMSASMTGLVQPNLLSQGAGPNGIGEFFPPPMPGMFSVVANMASGSRPVILGTLQRQSEEGVFGIDAVDSNGRLATTGCLPLTQNFDNLCKVVVSPLLKPGVTEYNPLLTFVPGNTELQNWKFTPQSYKLDVALSARNEPNSVSAPLAPTANGTQALQAQADRIVEQTKYIEFLRGKSASGVTRIDPTTGVPTTYVDTFLTSEIAPSTAEEQQRQLREELSRLRQLQSLLELPFLQDAYRTELFCFLTKALEAFWLGLDEEGFGAFVGQFFDSQTVTGINNVLKEINKFLPAVFEIGNLLFNGTNPGSNQPSRFTVGRAEVDVQNLSVTANVQSYLDQLNTYLPPEQQFRFQNNELTFGDRRFTDQPTAIDSDLVNEIQAVNERLPDPLKIQLFRQEGVTNSIQITPVLRLTSNGVSGPPVINANEILLNEITCRLPNDVNNALQLEVRQLPGRPVATIVSRASLNAGLDGFSLPPEVSGVLAGLASDFSFTGLVNGLQTFLPAQIQRVFGADETGIFLDPGAAVGAGLGLANQFLPPGLRLGGSIDFASGEGNLGIGPLKLSWGPNGLQVDASGIVDFIGGLFDLEILDFLPLTTELVKSTILEAVLPYDKLFGEGRTASNTFNPTTQPSTADLNAANQPVTPNPSGPAVVQGPSSSSAALEPTAPPIPPEPTAPPIPGQTPPPLSELGGLSDLEKGLDILFEPAQGQVELKFGQRVEKGGPDTTIVTGGNIRPNNRLYIARGAGGAPFPILKLLDGCLQPFSQRSPSPANVPGRTTTGRSPVTDQQLAPDTTQPAPVCQFQQIPAPAAGAGEEFPPFEDAVNLDPAPSQPDAVEAPDLVDIVIDQRLNDLLDQNRGDLNNQLEEVLQGPGVTLPLNPSDSSPNFGQPLPPQQIPNQVGNFIDPRDLNNIRDEDDSLDLLPIVETLRPDPLESPEFQEAVRELDPGLDNEPVRVGNDEFTVPRQDLPPAFLGTPTVPVPNFTEIRPATPLVLTPEEFLPSTDPRVVLVPTLLRAGLTNAERLVRDLANLFTGSEQLNRSSLSFPSFRRPNLGSFLRPIGTIAPLPIRQVTSLTEVLLGSDPAEVEQRFRDNLTFRYFECESYNQFREVLLSLQSQEQLNAWVVDVLGLPEVNIVDWVNNPLNIRDWLGQVDPRLIPAFEYLLLGDAYNFLVEALSLRQNFPLETIPEQLLSLRFSVGAALGLAVPGPDISEGLTLEV